MGMFDEVKCRYPLSVEGANKLVYLSKDTPQQQLETYEIREDGTLWQEVCDPEWLSDPSEFSEVRMNPRNVRWEQVPFEGELEIQTGVGELGAMGFDKWYSFRFWFRDGIVRDVIERVTDNRH